MCWGIDRILPRRTGRSSVFSGVVARAREEPSVYRVLDCFCGAMKSTSFAARMITLQDISWTMLVPLILTLVIHVGGTEDPEPRCGHALAAALAVAVVLNTAQVVGNPN